MAKKLPSSYSIFLDHAHQGNIFARYIERGHDLNKADQLAARYFRIFGRPPLCNCVNCIAGLNQARTVLYG